MDYSVLMTVYRADDPGFLRLSLESMLNQTVPSDDIVVVKDGPVPDALEQVIAQLRQANPGRIHPVQLPENVGLGLALNAGLDACRHELVARMDADDISLPQRCEKQLQLFAEDPQLDIVGCPVQEFSGDPSNIVGCRNVPLTQEEILRFARRPEDIYNEPKNAFVADFIGESNILDGVMLADYKVKFFGRVFKCLDAGFEPNEPVDVVIRPEDIDFVPVAEGHLTGTVTSVTFKGLNYDIIVDFKGFKWLIQTTDFQPVGATVGIRLNPEDIHIMHKSEYSGMFGDYSSYSSEYDELMEDADDEEE